MEYRLRASPEQFAIMLDFMEKNGDLSRPQVGPQGKLRAEQQWNELSELLNSVGGSAVQKQADKWKRVWSDWKTKTKKKASIINRDTHGTGGGPSRARPLNPLEERLMRFIGIRAIVGHQEIQEAGFEVQPSSEPIVRSPSPQQALSPPEEFRSQEVESHVLEPLPSTSTTTLNVGSHSNTRISSTHQATHVTSRTREESQPHSAGPSTPRRRRVIGQRRRQYRTPFEEAVAEFVRVEDARLRLEETRIKQQHEREMEQLRVESQRIAMEERRTNILQETADTIRELLSQSRLVRE